jgi:hypothetical protein
MSAVVNTAGVGGEYLTAAGSLKLTLELLSTLFKRQIEPWYRDGDDGLWHECRAVFGELFKVEI